MTIEGITIVILSRKPLDWRQVNHAVSGRSQDQGQGRHRRGGGKRLKRQGFSGIGVDGLAAAAGVTSGAFYSSFASKEALLEEMIGRYLGSPFVDGEPGDTRQNQRRLKAFLLDYLSEGHGRDAENGCVMPALSADVGRAGDRVRNTYQKRMRLLIERMSAVSRARELLPAK